MFFLLLLQFIFFLSAVSQNKSAYKDSIEISGDFFGGLKFYQNDEKLSVRDMYKRMRTDPVAFKYYKKSRTLDTFGSVTGFTGGFLLGLELGILAFGNKNKVSWGVFGTGIALTGISIPFGISANRNARKAVYFYNAVYR